MAPMRGFIEGMLRNFRRAVASALRTAQATSGRCCAVAYRRARWSSRMDADGQVRQDVHCRAARRG